MKIIMRVCLIVMLMMSCHAESLWQGEKGGLFDDHIAAEVGDSLTILVVEEITNKQKSDSTIKNTNSFAFGPGTGYGSFLEEETGAPNESSFAAEGEQNTEGEFVAMVTVRVIEVLDNQELLVEGSKRININNDKQFIYIKGIVKPENISNKNEVYSKYLANAEIVFSQDGEINNAVDPGLITKIFNMVF